MFFRYVISSILFLVCIASVSYADQFDDFKKQFSDERFMGDVNTEFDRYQRQLNKDFEIYKKTVAAEFKAYQQQVRKKWKAPVMSSAKRWVEYSKDLTKRRTVDFEKDSIRIEIQVDGTPSNKKMIEMISDELADLILETKQQAWQRDIPAQRIESKVKSQTKTHLTEAISEDAIITDRFFNETPAKGQVDRKVLSLLKAGEIRFQKVDIGPNVLSLNVPMPQTGAERNAAAIKPYVQQYSRDQKISTQLIYTVIHHESRFNPMARSHVPAYGLMQIVPRSAGLDATKYLFGKSKLLLPSYLYNSKNNIQIGAAYMHVLYYRYLKQIKNQKSRLYCAIAAYNTGAGNVAKAFTGKTSMKKAAVIINRMTPSQVYDTLVRKLPYKETRRYIKKIITTMPIYKSI